MMIGCGLWAITLGRFDIHYAISTLSQFSIAPREGHFSALLRVFGYLRAYVKGKIIIDTREPDLSNLKIESHNWKEFYPNAREEFPPNMPKPSGKHVNILTYVDASFANDLTTRRSVTGILIFLNKTPIKWYSKRQNTIETSTFGAELVAARIATELTMELKYKLRMLGIPLNDAYIFADNKSMVINTTLPSSSLKSDIMLLPTTLFVRLLLLV